MSRRPTAARAALVLACAYGWAASSWLWGGRGEVRGGAPWLGGLVDVGAVVDLAALTGDVPRGVLTVTLAVALLLFLLRRAELLAGAVAFGVLSIGAMLELAVRGVTIPGLELLLPGNLLAAWIVGLGIARARGAAHPDDEANEVVCGVLAATLVLAALSKLWYGGAEWVGGQPLALIVYERSFGAAEPLRSLRLFVAEHPWTGTLGALYTLVTEGGAGLFVLPRWRKAVALSLVPLFGGLFVLMGIVHLVWVVLPVALAWSTIGIPRTTVDGA